MCHAINHGQRSAAGVDIKSCLVRTLSFLLNLFVFNLCFLQILKSIHQCQSRLTFFEPWLGDYVLFCLFVWVFVQRENRNWSVVLKYEVNQ